MIEPWQVWPTRLDDHTICPVLVVSSALHLRTQSGRSVLACPVTAHGLNVANHIRIDVAGQDYYVMTEQVRCVGTGRFCDVEPWQTLSPAEIDDVQHALRQMVDF